MENKNSSEKTHCEFENNEQIEFGPEFELEFCEHQCSGSRLVVPFTPLRSIGPQHHAIVVGLNKADDEIWVAELSRRFGYRLVSLKQWLADNRLHLKDLQVIPNSGKRSNAEVAHDAAKEVLEKTSQGKQHKYHLLFNNCESFADRHTKGYETISPQVQKVLSFASGAAMVGGALLMKHRNSRNA